MKKNISIQQIENGYLITVSAYNEGPELYDTYDGSYGTKQYFAESPQLVGSAISDLLLSN